MLYKQFVKLHFKDFEGSAPQRMKKVAELWKQQKGSGDDSFDDFGDGGKPIAGKAVAGKSVAGRKCGGKKVAGKAVAGKSIRAPFADKMLKPHIVGGPDSLPPWAKKGMNYEEWMSQKVEKGGFLLPLIMSLFGKGGMVMKKKEMGGFVQALLPFLPMLLPMIQPLVQPLLNKLIGQGLIKPPLRKGGKSVAGKTQQLLNARLGVDF